MKYLQKMMTLLLALALLMGNFVLCASAEEGTVMMGVGYVMTSKLRLYSRASNDSEVLDTATQGECVVVIRKSSTDGWYRVNYNLQEGYMLSDCLALKTEEKTELGNGRINESIVYLRSGPGTEYSIVSSGFQDKEFYILGIENGWYKILNKNATCFVRSDLMDLTQIPYENADSEEEPQFYRRGETIGELSFQETKAVAMAAPGSTYVPISGSYIYAQAKNQIGAPYVFGGYSPEGFDCSGLVYYILDKAGYPTARTAADQYHMGSKVSRSKLKAGDLVFFENTYTSGISHVGIYAGDGKFIHAPGDGGSVCYAKLSGYWSDHFAGARRIG